MKFFEDLVCQEKKTGYRVCGDAYLCERTAESTIFILCDGIGSGIYANIAAITCSTRIIELVRSGISLRATSEMIASSMHRARKENIPFSAFCVAQIMYDGKFTVYTYEAPEAILIANNTAVILKPHFYTAGYEVIAEAKGELDIGDSLILSSDGVTQAGLGHGHGLGIASDGIVNFINRNYKQDSDIKNLPRRIVSMCNTINQGRYEDDTTLALINCRQANQLTLMTGPPSKMTMDAEFVQTFIDAPGQKVICGSSTAEMFSRESGRKVEIIKISNSFGSPPEYKIEGIDLTTEGAIMLNQVYNILGEPPELFVEDSVVERLCLMLMDVDVVNLMVGNAANEAHDALLFKQIGVRIRKTMVKLIAEKLREMGKLVTEKYY